MKVPSNQKHILAFVSGIIIFTLILIFLVFGSNSKKSDTNDSTANVAAITIKDGTQYIDMTAKNGFSPNYIVAKANLPTVLKVITSNTYDCSSTIRIPSQNVSQTLEPNATTEIKLAAQVPGYVMDGSCAMGMYDFKIKFE
jgi:plastocyanin domain-containing protein